MKINCHLIDDLLPLYVEKMTGEETTRFIDEHLEECNECQLKYLKMTKPTEPETMVEPIVPLKKIKKELKTRNQTTTWLVALGLLLTLVVLYNFWSKPIPVPFSRDLYTLTHSPDNQVSITFNQSVTHARLTSSMNPEFNEPETLVEAWSTYPKMTWNNIFSHNGGLTFSLNTPENPDAKNLYYVDYTRNNTSNTISLEGGKAMNRAILPRLAMAFYVNLMLIMFVVSAILYYLLRKSPWTKYLRPIVFITLAYPIAHFLIKGNDYTSHFFQRDLGYVAVTTLLIFGLFYFGYRRYEQLRR